MRNNLLWAIADRKFTLNLSKFVFCSWFDSLQTYFRGNKAQFVKFVMHVT